MKNIKKILLIIAVFFAGKDFAQSTFICPYTIMNTLTSPVTITWQIVCTGGGQSCAPCASGSGIVIPASSNYQLPATACMCLTNCSNCDIVVKLVQINFVTLPSSVAVDSNNTTGVDTWNTSTPCSLGQLPTLFWFNNSTRIMCN